MTSDRATRIRLERVRDLYGSRGPTLLAGAATTMVMTLQAAAWTWSFSDRRGVLTWTVVTLGAEALMALLVAAFHLRPRPDSAIPAWGNARAVIEALRGLAWSLMALLTLEPDSDLSLLAICITLVGLTAATTASLAVHTASVIAFTIGALAPAALFLVLRHDGVDELVAAGMLASSTIMISLNGWRMSSIYQQLIENRLDLAEQLDQRRSLQEAAEEGQRLAEEAARERTRFFGAASHDLRQPVHALGLYASLLRRDPPERERKALIGAVASCVEALDRLFNAILGVSQAVEARDERRIQPTRLHDVIARTLLQFAPEAERRGLALRVRPTDAWALVDPTPLERVLANLVSNALRYTERGGVLVAARRRGDFWELAVADTGIGLSEADRGRVFDAFFRVSRRHGEDDRAFGLGLATVRQICLTQGWDITLASRLKRGSTFIVRLPAAAPQAAPASISEALDEPSPANSIRVLVVEDDPLVADAVSKLLAAWNVEVHVCETSSRALEILGEAPGRGWLGILDYRLAGPETGLDVADCIRARHGDVVPLALLTGELDTDVFESAKARGVMVLQKPLRPIRLRALLASAAIADT